MKNAQLLLAIGCFLLGGNQFAKADDLHSTERIVCAFIPDVSAGKSSQASCSLDPEKAFSSTSYKQPASDHCSINSLGTSSTWKAFEVDLASKNVSWEFDYIADHERREKFIQGIMSKEAIDHQDATRLYEERMVLKISEPVRSISKTQDRLYNDPISQEFYDPPRLVNSLIIEFGDAGSNYVMHIAGLHNKAIVTEFTNFGDISWVGMRFGRCRISE